MEDKDAHPEIEFEQSTWRMKIGKTKPKDNEPAKDMWVISFKLSDGHIRLYYYHDATHMKRADFADIDTNSVPAILLSDDGTVAKACIHDQWYKHFKYRLQYVETTKITHDQFMARVNSGEDPTEIRKEVNRSAKNRKMNGRKMPDDWQREGNEEHPEKRHKIVSSRSDQEIWDDMWERIPPDEEVPRIQQIFRNICDPPLDVPLPLLRTALTYQLVSHSYFWHEAKFAEYLETHQATIKGPDPRLDDPTTTLNNSRHEPPMASGFLNHPRPSGSVEVPDPKCIYCSVKSADLPDSRLRARRPSRHQQS
jgi:hypothetical protein